MILRATNLKKAFPDLTILDGLDISIKRGESVAIMGPSGIGKSTLLHLLGLLDTPDDGLIELLGKPVKKRNHPKLRNQHIGFVFQAFHLLDEETVLANVLMPAKIARTDKTARALQLIEKVGLKGREKQLAKHLSGGEKQRVAIARALCNNPDLLLADEPTGNLDSACSQQIYELLLTAAKDKGLIIVTHDKALADKCDKTYVLDSGCLTLAADPIT